MARGKHGLPKGMIEKKPVKRDTSKTVLLKQVFLSSEFLQGWKDRRSNVDRFEDPKFRNSLSYERGRQFAAAFREVTQIRQGNDVLPESFMKFHMAVREGWIS